MIAEKFILLYDQIERVLLTQGKEKLGKRRVFLCPEKKDDLFICLLSAEVNLF